MTLTVEFYKDFDATVLDGVVKYTYAFRVLTVKGTIEELTKVIEIVDGITQDRAVTLSKDI
jgi:hypothetical protein